MTTFIGKGADITLSPVEQIPNYVPFDATLNTGFGGDYANLKQTPGSTTFHKATYNVTASGPSSLIVGDIQTLTFQTENVAHNGPYPDSTPNDPLHPKNVGPWDGLAYKPFYNAIVDVIIKFGDDTLNVTTSSGQTNLISGDVQNIIFEALSINATTGAQTHFTFQDAVNSARYGQDSEAVIQDNTIYAGSDKITVSGAGSNTVVGDAELFSMHALGTAVGDGGVGASIMFAVIADDNVGNNTPYQMGNDTINATATTATNTLIGDVETVLILAENADNIALGAGGAFIGFDSMIFGNDIINAGSGPNFIYGDVKDFDLQALAGNADNGLSAAVTAGQFQSFKFGSDTLNGGSNVDTIYGDAGHFELLYQAGDVSNGRGFFGSDGAQLAENLAISSAGAGGRLSTYIAGNDTIHGNGGDDTIVGDFGDYNITLLGGDVTGASGADVFSPEGAHATARIIDNLYTMGNDKLYGDAGNDTLIGDVQTLTLIAIDGNAHNLAGVLTLASFSGDTTPLQSPGSERVDTGSTLTFGNDLLDGGSGNDILIGDSIGIADGSLRTFLTYSPQEGGGLNLNQVLWGNDTLTGGTGNDQFAFQLFHPADMGNDHAVNPTTALIMQGNDTITDYGNGTDTLVFINPDVHDKATLDAHTTVTQVNVDNKGSIDSVITFDGGGSLTVLNTVVHANFDNVNVAFHVV